MKIRHFEDRLADIGDRVKPGRLLDVGLFVRLLHGSGRVARVRRARRRVLAERDRRREPDIRRASSRAALENLPDDGLFDVVSAFDLIEHVPDPRAFLRDCAGRLKPGGVLLISTPDTDHLLRFVMGSRWPMLQPMQHLYLCSRGARSQRALRAEGFDDVQRRHRLQDAAASTT